MTLRKSASVLPCQPGSTDVHGGVLFSCSRRVFFFFAVHVRGSLHTSRPQFLHGRPQLSHDMHLTHCWWSLNDRQSFMRRVVTAESLCGGANVKTPATDTELANSLMLGKRKTRPDEGLHDTLLDKRCGTHAHTSGLELDVAPLLAVVLTSCDLQRHRKIACLDFSDFCNTTTIHLDGPRRRGQVLDCRHVGPLRGSVFSIVRKSRFDWSASKSIRFHDHLLRWKRAATQRATPRKAPKRHRVGTDPLLHSGTSVGGSARCCRALVHQHSCPKGSAK